MQSSNTSEPFVQDTFFTFSTSCSLSTLSFRPLVKFFNIRSLLLSRLLRLSSCSIKPALHETRNFAIRTEESREAPKQLAHRQADRKRKSSCIIYPLFPTHWWLRKDQLTAGMLFRKHLPKPSLIYFLFFENTLIIEVRAGGRVVKLAICCPSLCLWFQQ